MDAIWGVILSVLLFGAVFLLLFLAYRKARRGSTSYDLSALQMGYVPGVVEISRQASADAQLPAPRAVPTEPRRP